MSSSCRHVLTIDWTDKYDRSAQNLTTWFLWMKLMEGPFHTSIALHCQYLEYFLPRLNAIHCTWSSNELWHFNPVMQPQRVCTKQYTYGFATCLGFLSAQRGTKKNKIALTFDLVPRRIWNFNCVCVLISLILSYSVLIWYCGMH